MPRNIVPVTIKTGLTNICLILKLFAFALKDAEDVTMRELLESPTFRLGWSQPLVTQTVSDISLRFESHLDEYLQFRVQRVINQITYAQKTALYQATNDIIKTNKAEQRANAHG